MSVAYKEGKCSPQGLAAAEAHRVRGSKGGRSRDEVWPSKEEPSHTQRPHWRINLNYLFFFLQSCISAS
jgi:hypothetical protein